MFELFSAIIRGFINSIFTVIGIYAVAYIVWFLWSMRSDSNAPKRFLPTQSLRSENQDQFLLIISTIIVLTFVYTLVHIN